MRVLLRTLSENNLLPYFKTKCAGRKSYKLEMVYKDLIGGSDFECHNAMADAKGLADVVEYLNVTEEKLLHYSLHTI